MANSYSKSSESDEKLLEEAKARFKLAEEAESENRRLALDDLEFFAGNQWPEQIKNERSRGPHPRPCLVINRMPQFVRQVTNDQRQNRPSIKVKPVDDRADVETAEIIQGLIRHIEYNSNADVAYDTAFESAAKGGFGYFRIVTDYVRPESFDQEILIKRIRNPFSVSFDPYSQEPDGSDANFAFVTEYLSAEEYKTRYPKSKLASHDQWELLGDSAPDWMPSGSARVAEYFYKEHVEKEIVLLSTGETVPAEELPTPLPAGVEILRSRKASVPVIKWCKFNGCEILEKTDWPGKWIPVIPVYGSEQDINGKRILEGIVRNAKDPARMYNYWASAETEAIALAPRAPFIAAEGQIESYKPEWESANTRNHSVLTYKPTTVAGVPVPPPQRNSFEPAVQAITQARMIAADDIKATTGIYDAALGAKSNETSGVAIQRRNQQAQTSTFHFVDNLSRSIKHGGRVLIDLIPHIYDTAQAARIIGEDGTERIVRINDPSYVEDGKPRLYALEVGKYDAAVDVGPSYATKRQEAAASMMEVTRAVPQLMQVAGDLMVKNMDWPGAQEIADRLKKTLPPNLVEDPQGKSQQLPPQVQAQMQQMSQMVEQLTGKLTELQGEKEKKLIELESKERIEMAKIQAEIEITLAKLGSQESLALLHQEVAQIEQRLNLLKQHEPIAYASQESQESQEMPMQGMPAESGASMESAEMGGMSEGQIPTGGASPGQPMDEGNIP